MKLTYLSHASLLLETAHATVLTDPWFNGPAYLNQWHVFPRPVDTSYIDRVTHIVLTHGHEDHYHEPTLQLMPKQATLYFPYVWKSGITQRIKALGFKTVHETYSLKTIQMGDVKVTYVINGLDAFTVYEYANKVILNLNDALNASHKSFIDLFRKIITKFWPRIDYMVCGLGGASYFPNTIHSPLKNDREIGILREQFLAHKFCELVHKLKPVTVIPFVPGFALLEKDKHWINEIKFSRNNLEAYYKENFDKDSTIRFFNMQPGDVIENDTWHKTSPYHAEAIDDNLSHLVHTQYAKEIEAANSFEYTTETTVYKLTDGLNHILPVSTSGISKDLLKQIDFILSFHDVVDECYIHCRYVNNRLVASVSLERPASAKLHITTHTGKLQYAIENEWGGDVFFVGYGADIDVLDQSCLKENLDIISLRLLSRFPSASYNMLREPVRAVKYLANNPMYASLAIRQKIYTQGNPNKLPYNERAHWINKSKCDVCRLCDIPLLSDEFGESLNFI